MNTIYILFKRHFLAFLFILNFGFISAQTPMTFLHPGALNGQGDLDLVKAKIQAKEQPWYGAFTQVKNKAKSGTNALTSINSNNNDANISKGDAIKTYANALVWYFTEEVVYAEQAIALLNAWSKLERFNAGSDQDKLQAGWIGALFGPAAEIMREYPGWKTEDMEKVQAMFRRAFYPQLKTASSWNGNVDLTQIDALMNIAVFCEDEAEFKLGIERLRKRNPAYFYMGTDPTGSRNYGGSNFTGSWHSPALIINGLTQETCRDNNHHAQYAMASALHAAEVAWNQGVDVYAENMERYIAVMELMATQILTGEMQGTCTNNTTTKSLFNTWEVGYNHYHNRLGLSLPNTERLLKEKVRAQGWSDWNIFHETLTHGEISPLIPSLTYLSSRIDTNARIITVQFTEKLILPESTPGFEVLVNDTTFIDIVSIKINANDSSSINIYLNKDVLFTDRVSLSYSGDSIIALDSTLLEPFSKKMVDIRLPGAENDITFIVKNKESGFLIDNCLVQFNNESKKTNDSGEISFRAFDGDYKLDVEKQHLVSIKNQSYRISTDTVIILYLDSTLYNVVFQVEDKVTGSYLSNVDVTIGSKLKRTNPEGKTNFTLTAGSISVYFDKTNYKGFDAEFQIESDTILPMVLIKTHAKIKFIIKNNQTPINNALLVLGIDSLLTSSIGICTFASVLIDSTFSYLAQKENYFPTQGILKVTKDTSINLQMNKSVASIEFILQTDSESIENARVVLNKNIVWFNEENLGKIFNLSINQWYTYLITSDNFPEYSDSLWLAQDTSVQIVLKYTDSQLTEKPAFKVYPNPASHVVTIESTKPDIDRIEIFDIGRSRVFFKNFDSPKQSARINLNLSPGVYLLKSTRGICTKNSKLLIN